MESIFESLATTLNVNPESVPILLFGILGLILIVAVFGIMSINKETNDDQDVSFDMSGSQRSDKE